MSSDSEESKAKLLEKLERSWGADFKYLFMHVNEHGVHGVMVLKMAESARHLFGEYSDMTPYLRDTFGAFHSGVAAASSIKGMGVTSFTQSVHKIIGLPPGAQGMGQPLPKKSFGQELSDSLGMSQAQQNMSGPGQSI